jgi:hypothetical protein
MRLNKNEVKLNMMNDIEDDEFVDAPIAERIGMVWDITIQLWSISKNGKINAQSRLQRHVANLTKA